jgi:hypothetical protein
MAIENLKKHLILVSSLEKFIPILAITYLASKKKAGTHSWLRALDLVQ